MDTSKLAEPNFIDRDANKITAELVAKYEEFSGKLLYPAQADRLMIDVIAYREMLIRNSIIPKKRLQASPFGVLAAIFFQTVFLKPLFIIV